MWPNEEMNEQLDVDMNNVYGEQNLPVLLLLEPSSKSLEPEPSIFIEPIEPKAARVFMLTCMHKMNVMTMLTVMKTPP